MLPSFKPLLFFALAGSLTVYYYYYYHYETISTTMSSSESWRTRAHPHPSPASYTPSFASLALLSMRDTPVAQNVLTLAVFTDKVAITASGEVLVLSTEDYDAIIALAQHAKDLPQTGEFRNTWRIDHPITSRPIDRVLIGTAGQEEMKEVSVYGYDSERKELTEPVGDITRLPDELSEVMEIILEGRVGYQKENVNQGVVGKIKDILPADL